ncbi:NAD kinase [Pigmentiphaga soli]|uniref:NAD kinase n=1 Tax=Pigmentiphaga soli TaxID=1007095 RepID=A0ABP8GPL4_9BURK
MHFPTVALVGRYHDTGIAAPLLAVAQMLRDAGREVLFESDTAANTGVTGYPSATVEEIGRRAALAIVVGGDGTMLALARQLAPFGVPLAGINHGRLGFITSIPLENATDAIASILDGQYETEERTLLSSCVVRDGTPMVSALALNDVVMSRAGAGGMIEATVQVDGLYMSNQRADGLIIATPTGSTAYALSANGPILHPALRGLVLVPVAPQTLSNRPIAIPDDCTIEVTLTRAPSGHDQGCSVHFDMQSWSSLQEGDRLVVKRADHTIRFLHPAGYSYFSTLRRKLHWNQMSGAAAD